MPHPGPRAFGLPFALSLLLPAFPLLAAEPAPDAPWALARNLDLTGADDAVASLARSAPGDARLAVAHAGGLLARQPRTAGNIAEARAILETVVAAAPAAGTDDQRPLARYLIARIDHDHLDTPDIAAARAGYEALRRDFPGHLLAERSAVHLGFILAYQTPGATGVAAAPAIETLLASVSAPAARRELHILLGRLHARADDAASALPHYQAARAIPCETPHRDGDIELSIATLASRLGHHELAARHYLAFAEARPIDARAGTARRLANEALAAAARQ